MKRTKELLLFLVLLLIPPIICVVLTGVFLHVLDDNPHFIGIENYIRMFTNDRIFGQALVNTVLFPTLASFCLVAVFSVIVFLMRKTIQVPRRVFYPVSVLIGGVSALIYRVCVITSTFRVPRNAIVTLHPLVVAYQLSVFDAINFPNVFFSVYIGILTAFIFWVLELIVDIVKNFRRKRNMK